MSESSALAATLLDLRGVWRDRLTAVDGSGREVTHDPHGGVPGAFPYENLVYIDFDGEHFVQTSVVSSGRDPAVRTFEARRNGETLVFTRLGPGAPNIVGISPMRGHLWFVADDILHDGISRYAEPDHVHVEGDRRWRHTVLWRHGSLVRVMHVAGSLLGRDTSRRRSDDPRGADGPVHDTRSEVEMYEAGGNVR